MTVIKTKKIMNSLKKKGFKNKNSTHKKFILYNEEGKKLPVYTFFSHGVTEYGDELLSRVANELYLDKSEFLELIGCSMSKEAYMIIFKKEYDRKTST